MLKGCCALCEAKNSVVLQDHVRDFEYSSPGEYAWLQCQQCGFIWLDPMPSREILALAYPDDYHAYRKPNSTLSRWIMQRSQAKTAALYRRYLGQAGRVLDVGCGMGVLLSELGKLGRFDLHGVEYHGASAESAKALGIHVAHGDFADVEYAVDSMDMVIMQHVLEHVFEPMATLQRIQKILRPGGVFVGEVPNIDSWDAKLFGRYWGGGHAPRHLFFFTPQTLHKSLAKTGFDQIVIEPVLHTGHWASSFQNYFRRHHTSERLIGGRTWYYPLFLLGMIPVNLWQMPFLKTGVMRFAAKKI